MNQKSREINIESLKTPKGDVPTVKGLESVMDLVFSEYNKLESKINSLHEKIDGFSDEMSKMENLETRLRAEMDSVLAIAAKIKLVEPKTIARTEGKAKRVFDRSEL